VREALQRLAPDRAADLFATHQTVDDAIKVWQANALAPAVSR
jgi:hypothetical protein